MKKCVKAFFIIVAVGIVGLIIWQFSKFTFENESTIFSNGNILSVPLNDLKSAFTIHYESEPDVSEKSLLWFSSDWQFFGKNIESATIEYNGDKATSIYFTFPEEHYESPSDDAIPIIDSMLEWFQKIEKSLNVKGTVYADGSRWDDYSYNFSFYGQANEAKKLIMCLNRISGQSKLEWKHGNKYISVLFFVDRCKVEAGVALN